MDAIASAEERIVSERLRQKLNEVNTAVQAELASVQDHVNFNLQVFYFVLLSFFFLCVFPVKYFDNNNGDIWISEMGICSKLILSVHMNALIEERSKMR